MELGFLIMTALTIFLAWATPFKGPSPAVILSGSWALVFFLQTLFASDMYSSTLSIAIILLITLAFGAGEFFGSRILLIRSSNKNNTENRFTKENIIAKQKLFGRIVILFGIFGISGAFVYVWALGLFNVESVKEIFQSTGAVRAQIYSGDIYVPRIGRIGFLLSYSGTVLSLAYYYYYKWRWWLMLPMLAVLILGISQAGRAGTFVILIQSIIIVIFKNIYVYKKSYAKVMSKGFILVSLMIAVFFLGQLLREGFKATGLDELLIIGQSIRGYLFGGVSAFAFYIDNLVEWSSMTYGSNSFSSLFAALDIDSVYPNVHDQYLPISSLGETTNVFGAYRSFIDDFTIVGAVTFYALAGFIIGAIQRSFISGRTNMIAILLPLLSWLAFSPFDTLTYFSSFLLSCCLPYLILSRIVRV